MTVYQLNVDGMKPPYDKIYMAIDSNCSFTVYIPKEIEPLFHNAYERKKYLKFAKKTMSKVIIQSFKSQEATSSNENEDYHISKNIFGKITYKPK